MDIILGTAYELHTGLHGSLVESPPAAVRYTVSDAVHTLLFERPDGDLFSAQALAECVDFGAGAEPVHSAKWPVLNRRAWVVDFEDFGYPVFCSHYGLTPQFRMREGRRATRSAEYARTADLRIRNMGRAFAHPSCKRVLVRTRRVHDQIAEWLDVLGDRARDQIQRKLAVLPAATRPAPAAAVEAKWTDEGPLRVLFCGRGFEGKRGAWAIGAFAELRRRHPATQCVYVGDIPDAVRRTSGALLDGVRVLEQASRGEVLALMAEAHVLFNPTESESVGAVILEAAAAGMCIITTIAPEMDHVREWFADGGAVLIPRTATSAQDADAFTRALLAIAADRQRARSHGVRNYHEATAGCLSIASRDRVLTAAYSDCVAAPSREPLTLDAFAPGNGATVFRATSIEIARARTEYKRRIGLGPHLYLDYEL